jgi:acyl-coenzyme A synthetase/AMP-(fatty) acid ligase
LLGEVEKWARVLRGMGLGVGDQILLFSPAIPEAFYVLFAADCIGATTIMPNMAASLEALKKYYAQAKVAFVFDGMADLLNDILDKPQFKCVVLMDATRSMSMALKPFYGLVNWVKTSKVRHRRAKYLTMSQALERFGGYAGPIEAPFE